jgi:PAS domain S-box-containing protein
MTSSAVSPSDGREQPSLSCAEAEQARLRALRRYEIVGTEPESNFDRITRVAASLFEVPIALINFVAEGQRWCKSAVGVESGGRSHRSSFCIEAIRSGETIVIEGAAEMERFSDHPLVEGPPGVRFYAGTPLETPDGHLIGTLCVLDTTPRRLSSEEVGRLEDLAEMVMSELEQRRRIRKKLQQKDECPQSIAENVSEGIYRSTPGEELTYANQAFIEMSGYRDLEELKAAESKALYADLAQRETLIEKETEEGRLGREEVQFRRKDGTTFVGLLSSQQVEGEDQEKVYFDGAVTDITERKRHEEKLERRQRNIEALYETTRSLLRAESREAVCDRIRGVLRRVFDYDPVNVGFLEEGAVRSARTDRSGDVEAPAPRPADGNNIAAQVLRNGETTVVTDLDSSENDVGFGAVRSAAGVPIGERGVIVVGRVEEKSFDRFNLRLVEVLAGYAALVLGRLEREDELREAKEEAEEAARLKASMLANMSHEIRTPLTSIIGFSEAIGEAIEMLEDRPDEAGLSQLARFATLIEQAGTRLLRTLDGVLNLSKLEAEEIEMDACPVDLAEQVRQAASELRPKAEEVGLDLRVEAGDTCAWANEGGVQIVLQNLLSNAIKYTGEGGEVRVRSCQNEDEAILIVEDTGIGMELEVAETLFEPFRQASEGLDRDYEGTGIGLTVVKRAVEQMDRTVDVKTQKGEGSRFTVRFPRAGKGGKSR